MPGKLQKSHVLFADVIKNANRAELATGEPDDLPPGAAELALQRLHQICRRVEMLLKQLLENIHEDATKDNIERGIEKLKGRRRNFSEQER